MIGLHFFYPVPILPIVEVVPSAMTSVATLGRVEAFVGASLGMRIIRAPDRAAGSSWPEALSDLDAGVAPDLRLARENPNWGYEGSWRDDQAQEPLPSL